MLLLYRPEGKKRRGIRIGDQRNDCNRRFGLDKTREKSALKYKGYCSSHAFLFKHFLYLTLSISSSYSTGEISLCFGCIHPLSLSQEGGPHKMHASSLS